MAIRARHSAAKSAHDAFGPEEHYANWQLVPGERAGPPHARTGGTTLLWSVVIVLTALVGGWATLNNFATVQEWLPREIAAMLPSSDDKAFMPAGRTAPAAALVPSPTSAEPTMKPIMLDISPTEPSTPAATAGAEPSSEEPPLTTAALPPKTDPAAAMPLGSPVADPNNPYQMRAVAVGLHPGLSQALLSRLSPNDYRNAGTAIETAIAETADSDVFYWPHKRKPDHALFQVRFVSGAPSGCRRYIVTVAKEGWLTTAPPMEKCGVPPVRPRQG